MKGNAFRGEEGLADRCEDLLERCENLEERCEGLLCAREPLSGSKSPHDEFEAPGEDPRPPRFPCDEARKDFCGRRPGGFRLNGSETFLAGFGNP